MRKARQPFWFIVAVLSGLMLIVGISRMYDAPEIIPWRTDFAAAQREAAKNNKLLFTYFTAGWCGPCQTLKHTTWADANVAKALQAYVPVIDIDAHPDLAARYATEAIPTFVVLNRDGAVIKTETGALEPDEFIAWLNGTPTPHSAIGPPIRSLQYTMAISYNRFVKSTKKQVNIGVVGCGARSRSVLKRLLPQSDGLHLRGIFDPDPAAIELARSTFNLNDLRAYQSLDALVGDPEIDWVMIGTWNRHHAAAAVAALDAGKNVFCEKPLATTLQDCLAVLSAVRRAKGIFAFGLVLRYSPHYQRIRQTLTEGRLGELISFEFNETLRPGHGGYIFGNWRRRTEMAGSHMLEKCCHDLDLANWMTGSVPVRIASFGGKRYFTNENAALGEQIGLDKDGRSMFVEWPDANRVDPFKGDANLLDHQVVILEYANGVCATFHANCVTSLPERRFYLLGTLASLRADAYDGNITFQQIGRDTPSEDLSIGPNPDGHGGGDTVLAAGLAATMLEGKKPLAGIDEAVRSAIVALAIDEAQATGTVIDLRPYWAKVEEAGK